MELTIEVVCTNFPPMTAQGGECGDDVHLAIQRGQEPIEAVSSSCDRVVFRPVFRMTKLPDGKPNFLGPFAKGVPAERFFYLSWLHRDQAGSLTMFRRLKVHLSHLAWVTVEAAARTGRPLRVEISMTGKRGDPRCASLREADATWHLA